MAREVIGKRECLSIVKELRNSTTNDNITVKPTNADMGDKNGHFDLKESSVEGKKEPDL